MKFILNSNEQPLVEEILKLHPEEYCLIRLTSTMLQKSIIDASGFIRSLFKSGNIIDYSMHPQGGENKVVKTSILLENESHKLETSFYRPHTKKGDPRFWILGLKQLHLVHANDMLFFTIKDGNLIIIPLVTDLFNKDTLEDFFGVDEINIKKTILLQSIKDIKLQGFIPSVGKGSSKDVGETFEKVLNILPNSSKRPDYGGLIELKAKRAHVKTKDTLFSMVPDYSHSPIAGSNEMIRTFGYQSKKYSDFIDLYVTVRDTKNAQGLFLHVDDEKNEIQQFHISESGLKTLTCVWSFSDVKERLYSKHKSTLWIVADEENRDGKFFFHYNKAQFTRQPIFSSFLLLVQSGIITYDWRGRVKKDGSGYKDKGHCFRISPKHRHLLFGEIEEVDF